MKKLIAILTLMLATSIATAQDAGWYDVTALHATATGNTDNSHALKQYLLILDDVAENNQELLEELNTFINEHVQMDINQKIPQLQDEMSEAIANIEKTQPELAAQMRKELAQAKEEIQKASEYTDPSVKSFTSNPADLLKRLTAIAVNRKPYSGHYDIGNGLIAVTEAPRYGPIQDDAFIKIQVADDDRYTWGAITPEGKTVIPQQYCLLVSYFIRPNSDFIVLCTKGKDGKELYGAYSYTGKIKIPFVLDDVKIINTQDNLMVGIKDGKYGSMDLDGNILVPFEYVAMEKCGAAWPVSRDGKNFGIVTHHGKEVVPFKYKSFWKEGPDYIAMERFDGKIDVLSDQDFRLLRTENPD
jgi:hypothetical protein